MQIVHFSFSFVHKGLLLLLLLFAFPEFQAKAGDNIIDDNGDPPSGYDALNVNVLVAGYGDFYVDAVYTNKEVLFINIEDLFKKVKIPCVVGQNGTLLEGSFGNQKKTYIVDYSKGQIKIGSKIIKAKNGLVKETGALYMESSLFAEAFGIKLTFNFRTLTLILKSDFELPIIKEMHIEKMRANLSKQSGDVKADTIVKRKYHLLKFGTMDWAISSSLAGSSPQVGSSPQSGGGLNNNIGLGLGTEFLRGETNVAVNYSTQNKFDARQFQYLWQWVDNDKKFIKQAQLGKISCQTISSINAPIIGAVIRNSPTTVRKATGSYSICDFTEPNWTVELYINNALVDYTTADASGLYGFMVPIIYGYNSLKLKFYGPMGETQTVERTINIPYTVMASKEFEYGLTGGMVQDSISSRFGKAEFNYGVNSIFTLGGGVEYLSSNLNNPLIPFAKLTLQPFSAMILNYEYAQGVKNAAVLNYYLTKNILLEVNYTKYWAGQRVTNVRTDEERKVALSMPFSFKKVGGLIKLDYSQYVYKELISNMSTVTFSAYYKKLSANTSTQINWIDQRIPQINAETGTKSVLYILSNGSLSYRIGKEFTLQSTAQYNVSEKKLISTKVMLDKNFQKGNFSISYEKNMLTSSNMISLSFKYDLSFAATNISASQYNGKLNTLVSAQGSLAFGAGQNQMHKSNISSVGKGGILLYTFLDLNDNGIFDKGEHLVRLKAVKVTGGEAIYSKKDSIVRIADLNPFTYYRIEFNDNDLDNIGWRFNKKVYQVLVDPNQFKRIYIPVTSVGEVSGTVYMNSDNILEGIGRIQVKIYNKKTNEVVKEIISESDGYVDYLGLKPGDYFARVDSVQLRNLDYKVTPLQRDFTIKPSELGDIVAGIDFVLTGKKIKEKPIEKIMAPINKLLYASDKINEPNENIFIPNEKTFVPIKTQTDLNQKGMIYTIQLASLNYYTDPVVYKKKLKLTDDVWYFQRDGVYNYVTGKYINEEEAMSDMVQLGITGFITVVDPSKIDVIPNQKGIDSNKKSSETKEKQVVQVEETIVPNKTENNSTEKINVPVKEKINVPGAKEDTPVKNEIVPKEQPIVSGEKGVIFTIQLAASKTYIEPEVYKKQFNLTEDVWFFEKDGYFKYAVGKYGTKEQATAAKVQGGIKGFVTAVDLSQVKVNPVVK